MMETYAPMEAKLTKYCRKKELYKESIEAWRAVCLGTNGNGIDQTKKLN
jgi:hypothetical protein